MAPTVVAIFVISIFAQVLAAPNGCVTCRAGSSGWINQDDLTQRSANLEDLTQQTESELDRFPNQIAFDDRRTGNWSDVNQYRTADGHGKVYEEQGQRVDGSKRIRFYRKNYTSSYSSGNLGGFGESDFGGFDSSRRQTAGRLTSQGTFDQSENSAYDQSAMRRNSYRHNDASRLHENRDNSGRFTENTLAHDRQSTQQGSTVGDQTRPGNWSKVNSYRTDGGNGRVYEETGQYMSGPNQVRFYKKNYTSSYTSGGAIPNINLETDGATSFEREVQELQRQFDSQGREIDQNSQGSTSGGYTQQNYRHQTQPSQIQDQTNYRYGVRPGSYEPQDQSTLNTNSRRTYQYTANSENQHVSQSEGSSGREWERDNTKNSNVDYTRGTYGTSHGIDTQRTPGIPVENSRQSRPPHSGSQTQQAYYDSLSQLQQADYRRRYGTQGLSQSGIFTSDSNEFDTQRIQETEHPGRTRPPHSGSQARQAYYDSLSQLQQADYRRRYGTQGLSQSEITTSESDGFDTQRTHVTAVTNAGRTRHPYSGSQTLQAYYDGLPQSQQAEYRRVHGTQGLTVSGVSTGNVDHQQGYSHTGLYGSGEPSGQMYHYEQSQTSSSSSSLHHPGAIVGNQQLGNNQERQQEYNGYERSHTVRNGNLVTHGINLGQAVQSADCAEGTSGHSSYDQSQYHRISRRVARPGYQNQQVEDLTQQTEDLTQQTGDLTQQTQDLTQQTEDLTQQSQHIGQESWRPGKLEIESQQVHDLTQQTEDLTQQTEDLTQQTEDLTQQSQHIGQESWRPGKLEIESQQVHDLTQQTEDLTQQTEDLTQQTEDLTQQSQHIGQESWRPGKLEIESQQVHDLTQQTEDLTQQTEDLTQQTEDLTQQSQHIGQESWRPGKLEIESKQVHDLTQQTEDLTQQTEDLTQQSQHIGQESWRPGKLEIESQQVHDLTQQTEDLTQQTEDLTQQTENLTQQTEDLTQQSQHIGQESWRPGKLEIESQQVHDLTQQTEDLTQQTEDLTQLTEDLTQQDEGFEQESWTPGKLEIEGQQVQDLTQQTEDLTQQTEDLTQQTEDLTQQNEDFGQQSWTPGRLEIEGQQVEDLTQQTEDLGQQTEDLTQQNEDFGQQSWAPGKLEIEGQQVEDLTQQTEDLGQQTEDLTQQNEDFGQQSWAPGKLEIEGQQVEDLTQQTEDLGQQTEDLTQQNEDFGQQSWAPGKLEIEGQQVEDLTQQTEDLGQQTEDLTQQNEDFGQQSWAPGKLEIEDQQVEDLTQQTEDLGQQTEDLTQQNEDFGQQSWAPGKLEIEGQQVEDLTQQTEDLGQQTEDLTQQNEDFGQQSWAPGKLEIEGQQVEDLTQQTEDLGQQTEDLTQQNEDFGQQSWAPGKLEIEGQQVEDLTQQTEDLGQQTEDLTQQNEDFGQQSWAPGKLEIEGQQVEDLTQQTENLGQQTEDLTQQTEGLTQQSEDFSQRTGSSDYYSEQITGNSGFRQESSWNSHKIETGSQQTENFNQGNQFDGQQTSINPKQVTRPIPKPAPKPKRQRPLNSHPSQQINVELEDTTVLDANSDTTGHSDLQNNPKWETGEPIVPPSPNRGDQGIVVDSNESEETDSQVGSVTPRRPGQEIQHISRDSHSLNQQTASENQFRPVQPTKTKTSHRKGYRPRPHLNQQQPSQESHILSNAPKRYIDGNQQIEPAQRSQKIQTLDAGIESRQQRGPKSEPIAVPDAIGPRILEAYGANGPYGDHDSSIFDSAKPNPGAVLFPPNGDDAWDIRVVDRITTTTETPTPPPTTTTTTTTTTTPAPTTTTSAPGFWRRVGQSFSSTYDKAKEKAKELFG